MKTTENVEITEGTEVKHLIQGDYGIALQDPKNGKVLVSWEDGGMSHTPVERLAVA